MKDNRMIKRILPVLLAALVVFSSLGLGALAPRVQAEETAEVKTEADYKTEIDGIKSNFNFGNITGNWTDNGNYDISWYDASQSQFIINTPQALAGLAVKVNSGTNFSGKTIKMGQNIDLSQHYWIPIGGVAENLAFSGTFDGDGYQIQNMKIKQEGLSAGYIGFIAKLGGTVKNVTFDKSLILAVKTGNSDLIVGTVVATNQGTVDNCHVVGGSIYGEVKDTMRVSGIVGYQNNASYKLKNCTTSSDTIIYGVDWFQNTTVGFGLLAGILSDNAGGIENCVNNAEVIAYLNGYQGGNCRHFIGGIVGNNFNKSAGYLKNSGNNGAVTAYIMNEKEASNNNEGFGVGGIAGASYITTSGCYNTGNVTLTGGKQITKGGAGGMMGIIRGGSIKYCYNTGKITSDGKKTGGIVGQTLGGQIETCYNTGEVTGPQISGFYVGGLVGVSAGTVNKSYSTGKITNETLDNPMDGQGGLTGTNSATFTSCFYINAQKADGNGAGSGTAISLAAIKKKDGTAVGQVRQGDDSTQVVLAEENQLADLKTDAALGANFGIQLPSASAFASDNPAAVQAVTNPDNTVGLKTSGGTGGKATFTAKMYLNQNELVNGTYTGPVKSIEAPITLNLNVVYVGLDNKSPTSAILNMTDYSLKAGVTFGGSGVDQTAYALGWFKSDNEQSSPPASSASGTEVTGMTETWDNTSGEVSWAKTDATAKFTPADAGWYKLKATPADSMGSFKDYTFETDWQYLSVDDLMIINKEGSQDKIELSGQDSDIADKTTLKVQIEVATAFTGKITYGWYKVDGTNKTLIAGSQKENQTVPATHAITDTLTVGTAYTDALKGTYQLIVTSVTPDGQAEQTKDIRGPSSEITCYNAEIQNDYVQAGPGYEGTPGNTMTQSIITLSEDFAASMYDAYWIKGGVLDNNTNLSDYTQVRHATLTDQGDGTYKAIATFNMEKGYEGDNYQLVIYPTNTTRPYRTDTAMQFKGAGNCALKLYAINTITYDLADSYSTAEMVQNTSINSGPTVGMVNPAEGTLTYTKVTGPEAFSIDPETGAIICSADPTLIANGLYTYSVKVTDERFKNDAGATLSGPGMSKTVTISFQVTGSSDFPLSKNLYIYQTGYIFADKLPSDQTGIIPYTGIYNIKSNSGTAYDHNIIVVSGNHTDGSRIILNESMQTAGVPITVKTGATAQVGIPDGAKITLTNTDSGGKSLQSDGSLILTGGATGSGTLTAPGGIAGGGSLTIGAAGHKGLTVDTAANDITAANTTIESGYVTAGSITGTAKTTIKGGNVKAETIGTSGATIIDGGSIIGAVSGAENSEGEEVYPVTLKLSNAPEGYANTTAAVTTQKIKADGTTDGSAKTWTASASASGELYVYLPNGGDSYTRFTATATPASGPPQTLSRKINADTDGRLSASLLATTYSVTLPQSVSSSETVAHGVTANITIGMDTTDGWLYEGRSIGLEISPGDSYKTIWGKYLLIKEGANSDAYKPEFWIQTPSGSALSKAGYFGTLTDKRNDLTGQLIVPADSSITEGTYQSQLNWKIIPNDPVVGGN